MSAVLKIIAPGWSNTIQDHGRTGYRHMGVSTAGFLDPWLADCANALAGNSPECACMEIPATGPSFLAINGPVRVALSGSAKGAHVIRANGLRQALQAWRSHTIDPGDVVHLGAVGGLSYLAVEGGWDVPQIMGSRSTHLRTAMGGWQGRTLQAGDCLPVSMAAPGVSEHCAPPWDAFDQPSDEQGLHSIRVMLGPQADHFSDQVRAQFLSQPHRVTAQRDRMGMRLDCVPLAHRDAQASEIASEGVVNGSIQVPALGQPVVLLADAQTVGGYPKIATVIRADLPRLVHAGVGSGLRFEAVSMSQALQALRDTQRRWQRWRADIRAVESGDPLYGSNLISGMIMDG